jgi:hypothetical protein
VNTWQLAEQNAAAWMRWWGHTGATVTNPGADGGIDVAAGDALGQVKWRAAKVSRAELQRLVGARGGRNSHQALFFFTGTGYSAHALAYAHEEGIALFYYELNGAMTPKNAHARRVFRAVEEREVAAEWARGEAATQRAQPEVADHGWRMGAVQAARDAVWAEQEAELRVTPGPEAARRAEAIRVTREAAREAAWKEGARQASIRAEAKRTPRQEAACQAAAPDAATKRTMR